MINKNIEPHYKGMKPFSAKVRVYVDRPEKMTKRIFIIHEGANGIKTQPPVCRFFDQEGRHFPHAVEFAYLFAERFNALSDFPEPAMMRETWEICKELKLDQYTKLKEQFDELAKQFGEYIELTKQHIPVHSKAAFAQLKAIKAIEQKLGGDNA
jgi:hypothetical protein